MSEIRYSIRIRLTDFIKSKREEDVISAMHECATRTGKKIFLKLWYKEGDVSQPELSKFLLTYEKLLEDIGTNVHVGDHESWTQKSWFNLRRSPDKNDTQYRYEYIYKDIQGILDGIVVFMNLVIAIERPHQKSPPPQHAPIVENKWKPKHKVVIRRIHER